MFPGSWYDGGGWDDAKYAAASRRAHRLRLLWVRVGCHARHERRVRLLGEIRADRRDLAKMKAGAGKVSAGFEAFCVRTGGGSQTPA